MAYIPPSPPKNQFCNIQYHVIPQAKHTGLWWWWWWWCSLPFLRLEKLLDFKFSLCFECCILSFGRIPSVRIVCADVSDHSVPSSLVLFTRPMETEQRVPKRRYIKFRRRGIAQKKENNMTNYLDIFLVRCKPCNICGQRRRYHPEFKIMEWTGHGWQLYLSLKVPRRKIWAGNVARMKNRRGTYRVSVGRGVGFLRQRDHLEDLGVNGRIKLKLLYYIILYYIILY